MELKMKLKYFTPAAEGVPLSIPYPLLASDPQHPLFFDNSCSTFIYFILFANVVPVVRRAPGVRAVPAALVVQAPAPG